jgi:hypothetical protein
MSRPICRSARSTPPIRTRGLSRSGLGSCRAITPRPRSTKTRSCSPPRSPTPRRTSPSLARWSPRPWTSSGGAGSISCPRRWPPTPATGTSSTWTRSWPTNTSRCWSRPTKAPAAPPSAGCPPRAPHGCAACLAQTTATSAIENANRPSSPCSATPSTTAASTASTDEAEPRCAWSGDC